MILNAAIFHELEGGKIHIAEHTSIPLAKDPSYKDNFANAKTAITFSSRDTKMRGNKRQGGPSFEDSLHDWIETCSAMSDQAYRATWRFAPDKSGNHVPVDVVKLILPRRFSVSHNHQYLQVT